MHIYICIHIYIYSKHIQRFGSIVPTKSLHPLRRVSKLPWGISSWGAWPRVVAWEDLWRSWWACASRCEYFGRKRGTWMRFCSG